MAECNYEELGHTAEIGLHVWAPSPQQLYACAAQAMFSLLNADVDFSSPPHTRQLAVESMDAEALLVDWLSELLYLFESTGRIYGQCTVTGWTPTRLDATVYGRKPQHPPGMDIKAVTYHQLQVGQETDGWHARIYFDI